GIVPPELGVQATLLVQHARHFVGGTGGFESLAGASQVVARRGKVVLFPRQHPELTLQPAGARGVLRGVGQPQAAAVPRMRARPLSLCEGGFAQPLGRRRRTGLVKLSLGERERTLEVPRPLGVLAERETDVAE